MKIQKIKTRPFDPQEVREIISAINHGGVHLQCRRTESGSIVYEALNADSTHWRLLEARDVALLEDILRATPFSSWFETCRERSTAKTDYYQN